MTLITAIVGPDWLAMTADRRLTKDNDPTRTRDLENKVAILRCGRLIVGYAGEVSWIPDHTRFEDWLLERTASAPPNRQMAVIREALQSAWREYFTDRSPAFSVLAVGYRVEKNSGALRPFLSAVSNAMDSKFYFNPHKVRDRFAVQSTNVPRGQFLVATTGFQLEPQDLEPLSESLKPHRRLTGESVDAIRASLVDFHLEMAEMANGFVGTQTMVVTVPRDAWPVEGVAVELSRQGPRDYERTAVAYTYNDPAIDALPNRPSFAPAFDNRGILMSGFEARVGATGMIGPRANLREIDW